MTFRTRKTLQFALTAGLGARRPAVLRHLLKSHGRDAFVLALASRPLRQIADVLSLLAQEEQAAICLQFSPAIRNQLTLIGIPCLESGAPAHSGVTFKSIGKWFRCFCTAWISRLKRTSCKNRRFINDANRLPFIQKR